MPHRNDLNRTRSVVSADGTQQHWLWFKLFFISKSLNRWFVTLNFNFSFIFRLLFSSSFTCGKLNDSCVSVSHIIAWVPFSVTLVCVQQKLGLTRCGYTLIGRIFSNFVRTYQMKDNVSKHELLVIVMSYRKNRTELRVYYRWISTYISIKIKGHPSFSAFKTWMIERLT